MLDIFYSTHTLCQPARMLKGLINSGGYRLFSFLEWGMKLSVLLLCFCGITNASPIDDILHTLTVENCGKSTLFPSENGAERIVGGRFTVPGKYPWMVSLREDGGYGLDHVCGASILNEHWILTAAHCIDYPQDPSSYEILAGLYRLSEENDPNVRRYKIKKIVIHKDYQADDTYLNDIAMLKTEDPIDIAGSGGYINGVCLPKDDKDPEGYAKVSGWGHTKNYGQNSNVLREVTVPIVPRDVCNSAYDEDPYDELDAVVETMICAGEKGKDSCQNDSGGPLVQIEDGVATQIGVVSHGAGCGLKYYPGVYTKVGAYLKWIARVMA